jgi:Nucleoside-diphosphate-sugar epimerases
MSKILVIGGGVFVSKAIVRRLINEGNQVYVMNRGVHENIAGAIHLFADRNDPELFSKAVSHMEFDVVYDICSYFPSQTRMAIENLSGRIGHFIHMSSATVYNDIKAFPIREDNKRGGSDIWGDYSKNKYLCEEELFVSWFENKFPATMIRPFYIYGPENNFDRESYVFKRILNGMPIILPGMGKTIIQFGYIDDLVDAVIKIANNKSSIGQAYNISGDKFVTFSDWVKICADVLEVKAEIFCTECQYIGYKAREWFPFRDIHFFGTCEKAKNELRVIPRYSLYDGLKQTFKNLDRSNLKEHFNRNDVERNILEKHLKLLVKG